MKRRIFLSSIAATVFPSLLKPKKDRIVVIDYASYEKDKNGSICRRTLVSEIIDPFTLKDAHMNPDGSLLVRFYKFKNIDSVLPEPNAHASMCNFKEYFEDGSSIIECVIKNKCWAIEQWDETGALQCILNHNDF